MILKVILILAAISFGFTMLLRHPQARRTGWIVTGSLVMVSLLIIQVLRTLDTAWR